ncbi:MAG: heparinase II/III family protein [Phycisphaerae bacterium]|nr:heparinase II/III family protein [Phycisphaerae bacterium]
MNAFWTVVLATFCLCTHLLADSSSTSRPPSKEASALFPAELIANARANAKKYDWAQAVRKDIIRAAEPWMKYTHDELWDLMFASTIDRSWMVWSSGFCPACKKRVPMYNWEIDALNRPWKVRCPHCGQLFPTNDFAKFYKSGLDDHGAFDPKKADRSLLVSAKHPDAADPKHLFGVDDGNGYVEGKNRWRFIGTYLIYGQWKQAIVDGVVKLAQAYVVTGDEGYAHRAGILLDRVADLYPTHDFHKQGWVYERRGDRGYVSTWHDACEEVRLLALAYDQIFDAIRTDKFLVQFLASKAEQYKLPNPKATFADIQRNIEDCILRDTIQHRDKILSNYPRTDVALTVIQAVLAWPKNRKEIHALIDGIVTKATRVDGMTGEKGLAGYTTIGPRSLAEFLGRLSRLEPGFLADVYSRHPRLHRAFRFHIDTWCLGKYYPQSGDSGYFAGQVTHYAGTSFDRPGSLQPSSFTFFWKLYELTNDPAFVQVLYHANDNKLDGLPYDILATDAQAFQKRVAQVIQREGPTPKLDGVNKQEWRIAVLRSGQGNHARAVWLDYDAGGSHAHRDGMNLGLFAKGLDLMPDFGYPPVQFGGWGGEKFGWYVMTASHNTVVVDGNSQAVSAGRTTLWADGKQFRAIRASDPALIGGKQYERTVLSVDLSDNDFYVFDVFRVVGGTDHAKFVHSHFGKITPTGLSLQPGEPYGHATLMRNFQCDRAAKPGWSVDWAIEDRYGYLPKDAQVHLRYTDLTNDAAASTAEAWVMQGIFDSTQEAWIPRIMIRRAAEKAPLASTFLAVIEPYEKTPNLARIRRLPLEDASGKAYPDNNVAVELQLNNGRRDLIVAADVENAAGLRPAWAMGAELIQKAWNLKYDGDLCVVRTSPDGKIDRIAICRGAALAVGDVTVRLKKLTDYVELRFDDKGKPVVASGNLDDIAEIAVKGQSFWKQ